MKLHYILPLSALLLTALPAFHPAPPAADVAAGKDEPRREVRQVAAFTEVGLSTPAQVEVRIGATQRVEVLAAPADLANLETVVVDGRLRIRTKDQKGFSWKNYSGPVKVYVTMPQVKALAVSGSGTLRAPETLRGDQIKLSVSGSGKLAAPVQVQELSASISGSGAIETSGSAPALTVRISGSGRMAASDLRSEKADVHISGSGTCRLQASQTLNARISGSGNVYYSGKPVITKRISGSGRLVAG